MSPKQREYVSVQEAADILGVHRQTIRRWLADGILEGEPVGRFKLIPRQEVENLRHWNDFWDLIGELYDTMAGEETRYELVTRRGKNVREVVLFNPEGDPVWGVKFRERRRAKRRGKAREE